MKKKKMSKFLAVAATTTMAVGSFGMTGSVSAAPAAGSEAASEEHLLQQAKVSVFNLYSKADVLNAYNTRFKVGEGVTVKSNAGVYDRSVATYVLDGNRNTHWETASPNNANHKNELEFTFVEETTLDRIIYAPRVSGATGKGFPVSFEIQGISGDSEEYQVVATGSYNGNKNNALEIQIESTKFKQLKFVFKEASEGYAAASEIMFYKQDAVAEKVERLFTNAEKTIVNAEFNTLEKLEVLEKEIAEHPLKADFIESIEDAKSLLAMEEVEPAVAETKAFKYYGNAEYKAKFMVPLANIESIQNNGGHYAQSVLKNAIDGDTSTYWETRSYNTANFKNTVEVEFKDAVTIDRLVYGARPSDRKGFITSFDIYVSPTSEGETYQLVSSGGHSKVSGLVEAKFAPTKAKRVKFVAKESDQNWATLSELAFFTKDELADRVAGLFTDGTQSEVVTEYNSLDKINALENEAKKHLLYQDLKADIDQAKRVVQGQVDIEGTIITAEQVGDRKGFIYNTLRTDVGSNLQPTGLAIRAGETITVYVEADGATKLPSMVFSQTEGAWSSWNRSVQLSAGRNVIKVPDVPKDNKYQYDVTKGGMIYIINPYTKAQQGGTPVIRIEGADRVPFMTQDTDPAEFKEFLTGYKAKLDADKGVNPNVGDRKVLDVVEIVSDHVIYTGTATGAYNAYITQGKNPMDTVEGYDKWMHDIFTFHGLDDRNETHSTGLIREPIRIMQPWGFMYAAGDHTGIQLPQEGLMFGDFRKNYPGWGLNHELGHRIDLTAREFSEVTNNMTSMGMSIVAGNMDNRIPYEGTIYKHVIKNSGYNWNEQGNLAAKLAVYWQLELAHKGYWAELESLYREKKLNVGSVDDKQQHLIKYSSDVLKVDLVEYFARHGIFANDATKSYTSRYPKSDKKIWYLNNTTYHYEGAGFTNDASVAVNIAANESGKTNTLTFSIDDANKGHLLGYEILRDGEVIGFTSGGSFVDNNVDTAKNHDYQVIAYDKKLNTVDPAGVKAFKPTISVSDQLTLKLNQEFSGLDFVKAYAHNGQDITGDVKVESSNVDVTKRGDYQVTFTVTNQGVTEAETVDVQVVSDFDYLSDVKATSHDIDWGGLRLDKAPEGTAITLLRDGMAATYKKGIGAHANSEIVYDVEGKEYSYFESYIGIDQAMKGKNSSATFEVWVDGEKVYGSGTFGSGTEEEFIKVPIKEGAKKVKLVTTDAANNHNTSDHTVWADAKFTKISSKPVISVKSAATKVGSPIDIVGEYTATDVEDGNLTSKVTVTGADTVNFNEAGDYKISYTVEDTDGNEVTATRTVYVVEMKDFKHLSTYNWKSESHSYAAPIKDKATSGRELRLTSENGEVIWYEKGIGAHSNSTIVYDLTDKEAAYFSSYVGVDRQMYNTVGSIEFKVYVDGVEKYTSGVMQSTDKQKYVEVDVAGAKELKLVVTDGGNGNGSDHATWGDAKLH